MKIHQKDLTLSYFDESLEKRLRENESCIKFLKKVKYTRHFLSRLEQIFQDLGYRIHYGKGNFQYGHCLVEDEKKIVVNKFFDVKGRIQGLLEILAMIKIEEDKLSEASLKLINQLTRESILL